MQNLKKNVQNLKKKNQKSEWDQNSMKYSINKGCFYYVYVNNNSHT